MEQWALGHGYIHLRGARRPQPRDGGTKWWYPLLGQPRLLTVLWVADHLDSRSSLTTLGHRTIFLTTTPTHHDRSQEGCSRRSPPLRHSGEHASPYSESLLTRRQLPGVAAKFGPTCESSDLSSLTTTDTGTDYEIFKTWLEAALAAYYDRATAANVELEIVGFNVVDKLEFPSADKLVAGAPGAYDVVMITGSSGCTA